MRKHHWLHRLVRLFHRTPERTRDYGLFQIAGEPKGDARVAFKAWTSDQDLPGDFGERFGAILRSYPKSEWDSYQDIKRHSDGHPAPHCDSRILHAPGECPACDLYPEWQRARLMQQIAFSGHPAPAEGVPCPADAAVAAGLRGDHQQWPGNRPTGYGSTFEYPVDGTITGPGAAIIT